MTRPHTHCFAAKLQSAQSVTTTGFCPPSSSTVGVRFSAAARATIFPTLLDPVKNMTSNVSASTVCITSTPFPGTSAPTTCTMRGSQYSRTNSVSKTADARLSFDGFKTTVFPAAIAPANGTRLSMKGKFQLEHTNAHPNGCFSVH